MDDIVIGEWGWKWDRYLLTMAFGPFRYKIKKEKGDNRVQI